MLRVGSNEQRRSKTPCGAQYAPLRCRTWLALSALLSAACNDDAPTAKPDTAIRLDAGLDDAELAPPFDASDDHSDVMADAQGDGALDAASDRDAAAVGELTLDTAKHALLRASCFYVPGPDRLSVRASGEAGLLLTLSFVGLPDAGGLPAQALASLSGQGVYVNLLASGESYDSDGSGGTITVLASEPLQLTVSDVKLRSSGGGQQVISASLGCPDGVMQPE